MDKSLVIGKKRQLAETVIYAVFALYMLILFYILFLDRSMGGERPVQPVPFEGIRQCFYESPWSTFVLNVFGNVAIFVPLGVFLPLLRRKDKRVLSNLMLIALASIMAESIQWMFALGVADVDDVILNTLGGFIGIMGYKFIVRASGGEDKAQPVIAIISAAAGVSILSACVALFVIN